MSCGAGSHKHARSAEGAKVAVSTRLVSTAYSVLAGLSGLHVGLEGIRTDTRAVDGEKVIGIAR
jgi:hypothetical protein